MLSGISKAARNWMAMIFVALYALCIAAPTAALAFNAVSCLTEPGQVKAHSHGSDAFHDHADKHDHTAPSHGDEDGKSAGSKCCGMVFCAALAPELTVSLAPAVMSGRTGLVAMQDFTGLHPDKLIRPPRS